MTHFHTVQSSLQSQCQFVLIKIESSYSKKMKMLTDSNNAPFKPMLPDGVNPSPPTKPAHMSERISPYKFGIT